MKWMSAICFITLLFSRPIMAEDQLKFTCPPSIWAYQQDGKTVGPIVDLMELIFADVNVELIAKDLPWARAIEQMKTGELDMIPIIFYSPERSQFMAYTDSYFSVPSVVVVKRGREFPFRTLDDLLGKRGIMIKGDAISKEFDRFVQKLDIESVSKIEYMLKMLMAGRGDYGVAARDGILATSREMGLQNQIETLPRKIAARKLYMAISKKSRFVELIPMINEKMQIFHNAGTLSRIEAKALDTTRTLK